MYIIIVLADLDIGGPKDLGKSSVLQGCFRGHK